MGTHGRSKPTTLVWSDPSAVAFPLLLAREQQPSAPSLDVGAEIDGALAIAGERLRFVEVSRQLATGLRAHVIPGYVTQIVTHLLTNAADAVEGRPSPRVRIVSLAIADGIQIDVHDNGPGIPREALPRIFDPFFTTKSAGRGAGLGLAVCHGLATKLGGWLSVGVSTEPGTLFSLFIPTVTLSTEADFCRTRVA